MRIVGLCLATLAAAATACAGGTSGEASPTASPGAPSSQLPQLDALWVCAPPNQAYPYYAGLPRELWPFNKIRPYKRYFLTRLPFRGPGQDYSPPPGLKSLKIGLLDPARNGPNWARGERSREGVVLAVEEANGARGRDQLPFELVERQSPAQWGGGANVAVDFAHRQVLGFLSDIDGSDAHTALRVAFKTETVMINISDPDPTLTETRLPWVLRVIPDQRQEEARLAELIVKRFRCRRIAIMRVSDRFGRLGVLYFTSFIRRLGCPPIQELLFRSGQRDIRAQIDAMRAARPDAIFFVGEPGDVGRIARQFRQDGIQARFFGLDYLLDPTFQRNAGAAAEGTTVTAFFDPRKTDPRWVRFEARFRQRWGRRPDAYAAYGYDGAQLMIGAILRAGPNRWRVRDQLYSLAYYHGVTGWMRFDGSGNNIAPVRLVHFQHGHPRFAPQPEYAPAAAGGS